MRKVTLYRWLGGVVLLAMLLIIAVQLLNASGRAPAFVAQWGEEGSGPGTFNGPFDVATDRDGNVYVTDSENQRVQKFTADGEFLLQWGEAGTGQGQFQKPAGIAVDQENRVYVTDYMNDTVQTFTSDGTFLRTWGSSGDRPGQFDAPSGVAVDATGHVSQVGGASV